MFIGTKKEYIRSGPKLYYSILGFSELIYDICVENYLDYNYISFSVNKEIIYNKNTSEMNCGKLDMFIDQDNALPVGFVLFSDFNIILTPKDESNIKQGIISYKSVYMGDEEREKTASSIIRIPVEKGLLHFESGYATFILNETEEQRKIRIEYMEKYKELKNLYKGKIII